MSKRWTFQRAVEEKPPLLHPLAGSSVSNFWKHYFGNFPYDGRSRLPRLLSMAAVHARFPFSKYESLAHDKEVMGQEINAGPIFIVGHWRSGTTHLDNIMSQDPQFGWISFIQTVMPWDIILEKNIPIARNIFSDLVPEKRGTDNVAMSVDSPQEEEWAIANINQLSFFNCYYFPRNYWEHFRRGVLLENTTEKERAGQAAAYERLVKTLHYFYDGKQLLFKNPSATARMPMLKKLFPKARFVHIVRNPYAVFASSLARFPRILSAFSWQKFDDIDFETHVLKSYEKLMAKYLEDRKKIPQEDLIETSYEELAANPMEVMEQIYQGFDLPGKEPAYEKMKAYLETLKGYQKNVHQLTRHQVDYIENNWQFAFDVWPYEKPEIEIVES